MKEYKPDAIRNLVLLGHGSVGKTSLSEAMLFNTGAITRIGRVEDGTTAADLDEEEIRRRISLNTALLPIEWKEHKINVLDTPGFPDFVGEVKGAVRVAECALIVVDSVAGVEVGTELTWSHCDEANLPRLVLISKMDRENAHFQKALGTLGSLRANFVPLFLPIGAQSSFSGVVDLVKMKARLGAKGELADIPAHLQAEAEEARTRLIEAAAEGDDELLMKYLDGQELTGEEIHRGLRGAIRNRTVVPVLCAASTSNVGVTALLEALIDYAPSPLEAAPVAATKPGSDAELQLEPKADAPLAALVFKSTADPFVGKLTYFRVYSGKLTPDSRVFNATRNAEERIGPIYVMRGKEQINVPGLGPGEIGAVAKLAVTVTGDTLCASKENAAVITPPSYPDPLISVAIEPKTQGDSAKMGPTLSRLAEEDPTLRWRQDASIKQTILEGMGDNHLDVAIRRAKSKFGVELMTHPPKVPYRETVTRTGETTYRHKKQTGGAGQFAEVALRVEPNAGKGYEFAWEVFGGAISTSFQSSIEKGVKAVMENGAIAGYPIVDVKCAVVDGKEHPVDSKPIAFETAGREAFKQAMMAAGPVLLEPIVSLRIVVPDHYMGDVIGDLNTKRAHVQGMDQEGGKAIVTATAPLAEVQRYATDLRSLTQGRGVFTMKFERYAQAPGQIAQTIIDKAKKERAGEAEE